MPTLERGASVPTPQRGGRSANTREGATVPTPKRGGAVPAPQRGGGAQCQHQRERGGCSASTTERGGHSAQAAVDCSATHTACSMKVLLLSSGVVHLEKGIGIARCSMTQAKTLSQQSSFPCQFNCLLQWLEEQFFTIHLMWQGQRKVPITAKNSHTRMCTHTRTHTRMCTHTRTHTRMCTHTRTHTHMR